MLVLVRGIWGRLGRVVDLVLFAVPVGVPVVMMILRCCFPVTFWREEFLPVRKFGRWLRPFCFLFEVSRRCEVFNILAEEVLKMGRRGCCGLFLLELVVYLHSLRFSGEVRLLKNSKFENLLSEGSFYLLLFPVLIREWLFLLSLLPFIFLLCLQFLSGHLFCPGLLSYFENCFSSKRSIAGCSL